MFDDVDGDDVSGSRVAVGNDCVESAGCIDMILRGAWSEGRLRRSFIL